MILSTLWVTFKMLDCCGLIKAFVSTYYLVHRGSKLELCSRFSSCSRREASGLAHSSGWHSDLPCPCLRSGLCSDQRCWQHSNMYFDQFSGQWMSAGRFGPSLERTMPGADEACCLSCQMAWMIDCTASCRPRTAEYLRRTTR